MASYRSRFPLLVVFDLDYTLWPFWVDTHITGPITKNGQHVVDKYQRKIKPYKDVPEIFEKLKQESILIGIASRTPCVQLANDIIKLLGWDYIISFREIHPGSKVTHFKTIHSDSGIPYNEMLFFDDENRNIIDVEELGVVSILVENGMTMSDLDRGMEMYKQDVLKK